MPRLEPRTRTYDDASLKLSLEPLHRGAKVDLGFDEVVEQSLLSGVFQEASDDGARRWTSGGFRGRLFDLGVPGRQLRRLKH